MTPTDQTEDGAVLAAVRAGDQAAFAALAERYRRQLHLHCSRMLGSFEDAEPDAVLRRFMDAHDHADVAAFAALLRQHARQAMPPHPRRYDGREAMVTRSARSIDPTSPNYPGQLRLAAAAANRLPAVAVYLRREGDDRDRLLGPTCWRSSKGRSARSRLRRRAAGGVRPPADAPGRPMSFRPMGSKQRWAGVAPTREVK